MSRKVHKIKGLKLFGEILTTLFGIIILILIVYGLKLGFQNQTDGYCLYLDTLLSANGFESHVQLSQTQKSKNKLITIQDRFEDLRTIYLELHKNENDIENFNNLMYKPFLPNWEYNKLLCYLKPLLDKRKIVLSGVSGSGKTTLVEKLASFISGSPQRILHLQCVEEMAVEYHKTWIGFPTEKGYFKGRLLRFIEQCKQNPNAKYIFILDDFDKIFPSTFFGSELWSEMDNPDYHNSIDGYGVIDIPSNFYLISVTHVGVANVIELNNEHYRRLGDKLQINPDVNELLLGIKERIAEKNLDIPSGHIKKVIYFFKKANNYIAAKYGMSYTLGQWATIRKKINPEDWEAFVDEFVTHVNAFKPSEELREDEFAPILYTLDNNGLIEDSHFFYQLYEALLKTGLFSELTVAMAFAIFSGLFGWIFILKKRKFINRFQFDVLEITDKFRKSQITHEIAINDVLKKKSLLERLILKRKIKYEESTFLLLYINEQINAIDEINKTSVVAKDFQNILSEYMADGVLDDEEYSMLVVFLDNIRSALSPEVYYSLKKKIDDLKT
ncbi:MAG: AAA family ATPase [bacterium]